MKFNFTNLDHSIASFKGSNNQGGTTTSTNFASMLRHADAPVKKSGKLLSDASSSTLVQKDPRVQKTRQGSKL